jgi:hypothetical protein
MKPFILFVINYSLVVTFCAAQPDNMWVIGYNPAGVINPSNSIFTIDYRNGNITYDTAVAKPFSFRSNNASICDSAGNLLFYTNGITVMNAQHDTMLNGEFLSYSEEVYSTVIHLSGLTLPQMSIIIPAPAQPGMYYLIHQTMYLHPVVNYNFYCDTLFYSIIDMSQDSGRGAVISKANLMWLGNVASTDLITLGGLTACKHANGRDWWVIAHKDSTNEFLKFLLTPGGFSPPVSQTLNPVVMQSMMQACFSPDGNWYAFNNESGVHVFQFDRCSGVFYGHRNLGMFTPPTYGAMGVTFSPNSKVLYASGNYEISQWDLNASPIASSKITVCIYDSFPCPNYGVLFYQMHLAANNKIYISSPNSSSCLSVIHSPDSLGVACNAEPHGLNNLPFYNAFSVPYYPEFNLGAEPGTPCDTLTYSQSIPQPLSIGITPNPSDGNLQINYHGSDDARIDFINSYGQIVQKTNMSASDGSIKVKVHFNASGCYTWKFYSKTSVKTGKIILIK